VKPVICMVTDRRRLSGAEAQVRRVAAAAAAGVHLVQVRERDLDGRALLELVAACVAAVRHSRTRVVVNDRLDVALAAGAHGVHLRADSVPAARIRGIVPPGFLIGRSVHAIDEARRGDAEGGLDYLVFGTVFATPSKPGIASAGPSALAGLVSAVKLPVLAIGGITASTARLAAGAGAAGVAGIGLFAGERDDSVQEITNALAVAFDTPGRVP
jgi:thiamine-phosphate pyrophosphorylase